MTMLLLSQFVQKLCEHVKQTTLVPEIIITINNMCPSFVWDAVWLNCASPPLLISCHLMCHHPCLCLAISCLRTSGCCRSCPPMATSASWRTTSRPSPPWLPSLSTSATTSPSATNSQAGWTSRSAPGRPWVVWWVWAVSWVSYGGCGPCGGCRTVGVGRVVGVVFAVRRVSCGPCGVSRIVFVIISKTFCLQTFKNLN